MDRCHLQMALTFVLASGLTACGGSGGSLPSTAIGLGAPASATNALASHKTHDVATVAPNYVAVDVGGGAVGNWEADTGYSSASGWSGVATINHTVNTSNVVDPAPQSVYRTQRYGPQVTYVLANLTPHTPYYVRLHFVESYFDAPRRRVFTVQINKLQVLSSFDVFTAAGGQNIANVRQFSSTADASGRITIALSASVNNASIAGIEVSKNAIGMSTPAPTATPSPHPVGYASNTLCVGGTQYKTTEDDEFSSDNTLNYTSSPIFATPPPNGAMWSTQFAFLGRTNNVADDAYYTDPSQGFGGYNPFSLRGGALNITAEPVPSAYAAAPALTANGTTQHWLSGMLLGPALTYGYIEVSAKEPTLQGFWPVPLWLETTAPYMSSWGPPNLVELDANEVFGSDPYNDVWQTIHYGYNSSIAGEAQQASTQLTPIPNAAFHTYGILWTPTGAQFFIDRVATSPFYPATSTGPMNPIINLSVFKANTWSPPPAQNTAQTMSLQYFRWYQSTSASCSPTVIASSLRGSSLR
jgi:hypothetical protein